MSGYGGKGSKVFEKKCLKWMFDEIDEIVERNRLGILSDESFLKSKGWDIIAMVTGLPKIYGKRSMAG
jgi:hypothetical protein